MDKCVLVTGSCGLIGSESVSFFAGKGFKVIGIDNNLRKTLFGPEASVEWNKERLIRDFNSYKHYDIDIRRQKDIEDIFREYKFDLIIHTAAQPSHDWAAREPFTDFSVNANGTLVLLENMRKYADKAVFIFTSTNKVYGDRPNFLPLVEQETRYELPRQHRYYKGIDETMSLDNCLHSLFGVSKLSADMLTQEYGKYFGLKTGVFRGGCLTGGFHSGTELHGFLSYLVRCCLTGKKYTVYGYKAKQVRDNIHSSDLVNAFYHFYKDPKPGRVYNIGGGRFSNISILEAIQLCQEISGKKLNYDYKETNRIGDHIWWITDNSKFESDYPGWRQTRDIKDIISGIFYEQKKII
jgi:CDP-paratose 2-epimerase